MFSKRWGSAFAATMTASLLYSSQALAVPSEWAVHSPSLGRADAAARNHTASRGKHRLMAEFPQTGSSGRWRDSNLVHVFPKVSQATYDVTPINNPRAFCPRVGTYLDRINSTEDGVMDILSVGLTQAQQIGVLINNANTFKTVNGSAFEIVGRVQAEIGGISAQISAYNEAIAALEGVVSVYQAQVTTLTAQRDAAQAAAATGLPPNDPTIAALQTERARLEQEIGDLTRLIALAESMGMDVTAMRAQLATKQARVTEVDGLIATAAAPYRAQKQAEANALTAQIDDKLAQIGDKQDEIDGHRQFVIDKRLEMVDFLVADDYIAAQGKLGQYSAMLRQYTQLNDEFRTYRRPIISDAMLVVNFAKQNFNDYSTFDAGYAMGVYPVWDSAVLELPGFLNASLQGDGSVMQPRVTAQLGTLHNVKFSTREGTVLSAPPVKFNTYRIDNGSVMPLPDMSIAEDGEGGERYAGFTRLTIIPGGDAATTEVVSDDMVNDQVNPKETLRSTGQNPQAEVVMGLGTFCGNIEVEEEEVDSAGDDDVLVRLERTRFVFTPHPQSSPIFSLPYTVDYDIKAQATPHEAKCEFHVENYYEASRNWGRSSFNFLGIIKRERRWDDRHIRDLQEMGFFCTFVSPADETDPVRIQELDALNEMALAEAYGRFVKTAAKQWYPEQLPTVELDLWKNTHKRHTWSPAMQTLCGGNPICNVVIEVFNSVEDIAASGATSIRATGRLDVTVKNQRSWATVLHDQVIGQIGFRIL